MNTIILFFILFLTANCYGQNVFINPGVDTTDTEVVKAISIWTNYLNSKPNPENMQTSSFWDETEKKKYAVVDQLYNSLGDTPPYELGKPTILYVKPVDVTFGKFFESELRKLLSNFPKVFKFQKFFKINILYS